jgi:L-aspartate oxidase
MPELALVFTAELAGGLVADCLHGANRLASNSLLECVVTTRLAAQTIADRQAFQTAPSKRSSENPSAGADIFSDGLQNTFSRPTLQAFNQH